MCVRCELRSKVRYSGSDDDVMDVGRRMEIKGRKMFGGAEVCHADKIRSSSQILPQAIEAIWIPN